MTSSRSAAVRMPEAGESPPLLSVVIPTLNREQPLVKTIEYFMTRETYRPFELIVVDQSERHESATERYLDSVDSRIHLDRATFKSLPRARNRGLELAKGEIVVFVDDDVEPYDGFLAGHLAPYADAKVSMVTGPAPAPGEELTGRDKISDRQYRDLLDGHMIGLQLDFDYEPCSWGVGCNFSVRRDVALRIGGFDETFVGVAVGEDAEFSNRLRQSGGVIHYAVRAGLVHVQVASGGCRTAAGIEYVRMFAYNQNYFHRAVKASPLLRLQGNWSTYRRLVLNRHSLGNLTILHWAFLVGAARGLRQPLAKFGAPQATNSRAPIGKARAVSSASDAER